MTRILLLALALSAAVHAQDEWSVAEVTLVVDELVEEALEQNGAVGFSVAVGLGDEVVLSRGYGMAELEHGVPAGPATMFRIGSITKQFTAALIMRLVEQGKLDLDAPLETYLPDYDTQGHTVTLRHLLNHTSGIKSYTSLGPEWMRGVSLELRDEELIALFEDEPFEFAPGEKQAYNNSGYYLLGVVIKKVARRSFARTLAREITGPLGLARTRYGSNADLIPDRAQGYRSGLAGLTNDGLIGMKQPGAAGALLSTAGDLVRWQQALVRGDVVSAESYALMTTPTVLADGREVPYGFGLELEDTTGGRTRVAHGGGIFGFNSMLAHYPAQRLHVAVISNSEAANSGALEQRIAQRLQEAPPNAPHAVRALALPRYDSPRLRRLAAEIERDPAALERFWEGIRGSGPVIEPEPGRDDLVWVTFVWRGVPETQTVELLGGPAENGSERMRRIPRTDLWFLSKAVPVDSRFTYLFGVDRGAYHPRTLEEEELLFYFADVARVDPLNPHTHRGSSLVELPRAPAQPWIEVSAVPRGELREVTVHGEDGAEDFVVHLYTPPGSGESAPSALVVLFDGGVYGADDDASVPTPTILDNLLAAGRIRSTALVLVPSGEDRAKTLSCSAEFADLVAERIVPFAREQCGMGADPSATVIGGSSLGGLMASYTALRHPGVFGNVLSQSGSFWFEPGWGADHLDPVPLTSDWFVQHVLSSSAARVRFYMEVGTFESPAMMVASNRHVRDILRLRGHDVTYAEYNGGHDYACWRGSLADGLLALLGSD